MASNADMQLKVGPFSDKYSTILMPFFNSTLSETAILLQYGIYNLLLFLGNWYEHFSKNTL